MQLPSGSDMTSSQFALSAGLSHVMIGNVDEGVHGQRPHTMSYLMIYHTTTSLPRPVSRELYSVNGAKWTSEEIVAVERRRWTFLSRHSD